MAEFWKHSATEIRKARAIEQLYTIYGDESLDVHNYDSAIHAPRSRGELRRVPARPPMPVSTVGLPLFPVGWTKEMQSKETAYKSLTLAH